jgi:hypothetical protein
VSIRWRLAVLGTQLLILGAVATYVTGAPVSAETWYFAGLLAVVINPQLLEPWYPRPQDVIVNVIIGLVLYFTSTKSVAAPGWDLLLVFMSLVGFAALFSLVVGAGREEGRSVGPARAARTISTIGSATAIYSAIFWLSAVEYRPDWSTDLWALGGAWAGLMIIGHINWQSIWAAVARAPTPGVPQGVIGPSILLVSGQGLPVTGTPVEVKSGRLSGQGWIMTRIQRARDTWAEVFLPTSGIAEELVQRASVEIQIQRDGDRRVVGAVGQGSTDRTLDFVAARPLKIGEVVTVSEGDKQILYQLIHAEVDRSNVRGGSHLSVRAKAAQVGEFVQETQRITRHQWVPAPGASVRQHVEPVPEDLLAPENAFLLGHVIATKVPVYVNLEELCKGHLVILGMTRMGKTSLAIQLARALATERTVGILDQTGEYQGRRGLPPFREEFDRTASLSVIEPEPGQVAAERALACLKWFVNRAVAEYKEDEPCRRVLVLEEAHQFVPEPAGLGFGAPGRDQAYEFGTLMMQIRKYGLAITLISQRTAVVAKSALSQCENIIAFKSVDQTGLDYLGALMGADARVLLPGLMQGQALVFGPAMSCDGPVAIQVVRPPTEERSRADPLKVGPSHLTL